MQPHEQILITIGEYLGMLLNTGSATLSDIKAILGII